MAKAVVIATAVLAATLATAPAAVAGGQPPPNPSIAQYIETVPTSGGSEVPSGSHGGGTAHLSGRVVAALPKGPEGATLKTIATAQSYGAPQHKLHAGRKALVVAQRAAMEPPKSNVSGATFSAAVDAVGAQRSLVVWLGVVLLAALAVGIGAAFARARR
jgi:hypothetical protein